MGCDGLLKCRVPIRDLEHWKGLASGEGVSLSKWVRGRLGESPFFLEVVSVKAVKKTRGLAPLNKKRGTERNESPVESVLPVEATTTPDLSEPPLDGEIYSGETAFKFGRTMYEVLKPDGSSTWSLTAGVKGEKR